eukprot:COSAG06_NODE_13103_length_1292_cov_5.098910_2_plen_103_part_01
MMRMITILVDDYLDHSRLAPPAVHLVRWRAPPAARDNTQRAHHAHHPQLHRWQHAGRCPAPGLGCVALEFLVAKAKGTPVAAPKRHDLLLRSLMMRVIHLYAL